jgi:hypothetical protein
MVDRARAEFLILASLLGAAVILAIEFDDGCTKLVLVIDDIPSPGLDVVLRL